MAIPNTVPMKRKPTHPGEMLREDLSAGLCPDSV